MALQIVIDLPEGTIIDYAEQVARWWDKSGHIDAHHGRTIDVTNVAVVETDEDG